LNRLTLLKENETMNLIKYTAIFSSLSLLMAGCDDANSNDEYADTFSLLNGNGFVLEVDRILAVPDARLPMDDLQESDYIKISEGTQYHVTFAEDGNMVTIEPGSVSGQKTNDGGESRIYELDVNVFAGGRFVVWISNDCFEAELTIYGSGVPILKSERGCLTAVCRNTTVSGNKRSRYMYMKCSKKPLLIGG